MLLNSETIFAGSKLALRVWFGFLAMFLLTKAKKRTVSAGGLAALDPSHNSTWPHKLMQAMKEREAGRPLKGLIQLDDAFWGGRRRGKRGYGAQGKTPLVVAQLRLAPHAVARHLRKNR